MIMPKATAMVSDFTDRSRYLMPTNEKFLTAKQHDPTITQYATRTTENSKNREGC